MMSLFHIATGAAISLLLVLIYHLLMRRYAAPTIAGPPLSDDEKALIIRAFDRVDRKSVGAGILATMICTWPIGYALFGVNTKLINPAADAVYDGRRMEWWLLSGLCMSAVVGGSVAYRLGRWYSRPSANLFDYYVAIRYGFHARKGNLVIGVLMVALALVAGWGAWDNGIIVDERGIRVRIAWFAYQRSFADVESVELTEVVASDDDKRRVLRVHFRGGVPPALALQENERDRKVEDLERITTFIRSRVGGASGNGS